MLKTYLKDLVTMGIDKCRNRKLILCPRLFAKSLVRGTGQPFQSRMTLYVYTS